MINVYIYTMEHLKDVELTKNLDEHCSKYTLDSVRKVSRYAYYLLSQKLEKAGYDPAKITFTEKGKGVHPYISFSMSHSRDYIVFAISEASCGVDVEEIVLDERLHIAKRILTEEEYNVFEHKLDQNGYLTEKWTLKEAYGKFLGIGMVPSVFNTTIEGFSFNVKGAVVSVYPKERQTIHLFYEDREIS
jgi:phosphopantetheinyl transferase